MMRDGVFATERAERQYRRLRAEMDAAWSDWGVAMTQFAHMPNHRDRSIWWSRWGDAMTRYRRAKRRLRAFLGRACQNGDIKREYVMELLYDA